MVSYGSSEGAQPHERVYANQISEGLRRGKYMLFERPSLNPFVFTTATQVPALPTAAQGQADTVIVPGAFGHNGIEMFQTTAQSKFPARIADKGIEIGLDLVDNESVEYVPGGNDSLNPFKYVAGTDPGVLIRAVVEVTDVSGTDQFLVGFRRREAYAVPTSLLSAGDGIYTDFFGVGFSGAASPNDVKTMSDLNNSGSTTVTDTSFNWADTEIHELEVRIIGRKVQVFINRVRIGEAVKFNGIGASITSQSTTTVASYTFDSGDEILPWIFHRYATTTPGTVILRRLEVAQLLEIGLKPDQRDIAQSYAAA